MWTYLLSNCTFKLRGTHWGRLEAVETHKCVRMCSGCLVCRSQSQNRNSWEGDPESNASQSFESCLWVGPQLWTQHCNWRDNKHQVLKPTVVRARKLLTQNTECLLTLHQPCVTSETLVWTGIWQNVLRQRPNPHRRLHCPRNLIKTTDSAGQQHLRDM